MQSLGTDADTKFEIANALAAGKEVTVHQADINVSGWTGMGYIILDPDTGAGAYKISGGASGGFMLTGLGIGLCAGAAVIVAGPLVAALAGAVSLLLGVAFTLSLDTNALLAFMGGRFLGTVAGMVLSIILGQYVMITLPGLFVVGLLYLMLTVVRLMVMELLTALAHATSIFSRERMLA